MSVCVCVKMLRLTFRGDQSWLELEREMLDMQPTELCRTEGRERGRDGGEEEGERERGEGGLNHDFMTSSSSFFML